MKKFTTVTGGNLHLIKHRMEQFVNRHDAVEDTWYYPTSKKRNKKMIEKGLLHKNGLGEVEKSVTTIYPSSEIKVSMRESEFDKRRYIGLRMNQSNAAIIDIGNKIRMTSTQVVLIAPHPTKTNEKAKIIFIGK